MTATEGSARNAGRTTDHRRNTDYRRSGKTGEVADHVVVTDALRGGETELVVDVQPVGGELLSDELVERELHLLDDVVHQVVDPTHTGVTFSVRLREESDTRDAD